MIKFNIEDAVKILQRTPDLLGLQLLGLSEEWINNNEGEDTWSPYDVIGHLIHGEQTDWMIRAMVILEAQDKKFKPFNRFSQLESDQLESIENLLSKFKNLRNKNLEKLKKLNLNQSQMTLVGVHPDFNEVTLQQLLSAWVVHDLGHLNQINRVLAKNYRDEVGHFIDYLNILKR